MFRGWWPVFGMLMACSDAGTAPLQTPASSATTSASATALAPASGSALASATAAPIPEPPAPALPSPPIELTTGGKEAVSSSNGMVVSVDDNATRAGAQVLEDGGNAIDAAVTVGYVLAVTHPSAGNIGGGGFMIVRLASGESYAIDFREAAPAAATTAKVVAEVNAGGVGYASVAVPGTVAGLNLARDKFGMKPLKTLLAPAIKLAKEGHKVSPRAAWSLKREWDKLKQDPATRAIWAGKKGALTAGERVVQKDLANTLSAIAAKGDAGFYQGPVAEMIESAMKKNKGDVTKADLAAYKPKLREPLRFSYRGFTVETMPPPSMGGIAVAETLLQLERLEAYKEPEGSAKSLHLFLEAAKRSYADRRSVGADPDFYGDKVPAGALERLLSGAYLTQRKPLIDRGRATPTKDFSLTPPPKESPETTHFSVLDRDGNAVSCTYTLSAAFGAKVVPPGTGVMFSNALGAFSAEPPNDAAPGKHMASSMSPTIVSRDGKVEIVIGSPGGDTIPNTVSQVLVNLIDYKLPVDEAVKRPRVHHQLLPDEVRTEAARSLPEPVRKELEKLGHTLAASPASLGDVKVIMRDPKTGKAWGFADQREGGLALGAKGATASAKTQKKPKKGK